jgi:hypothetical protein
VHPYTATSWPRKTHPRHGTFKVHKAHVRTGKRQRECKRRARRHRTVGGNSLSATTEQLGEGNTVALPHPVLRRSSCRSPCATDEIHRRPIGCHIRKQASFVESWAIGFFSGGHAPITR